MKNLFKVGDKVRFIKSNDYGIIKSIISERKIQVEDSSNFLSIVNYNDVIKFDKLTDYYLMLAARNEHLKKTILKARKKKLIVISDRFIDSTYAYQVIGNKISKDINLINQKYILQGLKPDLTIVLKASFKAIHSRIRKRKNNNNEF